MTHVFHLACCPQGPSLLQHVPECTSFFRLDRSLHVYIFCLSIYVSMNIWLVVTSWLLEITLLRMEVCGKYLLKTLLSDRLDIYPEVRCCSTYIIRSQCHFHFSTLSVHALQAICSLLSSSLLSTFHLADENITGYLSLNFLSFHL